MRRRTLALVVLSAVAVSSGATWFASSRIHSPAEIAARTAPPEPTPILVPVEERVLATKVVSRGTGNYGSPRDISVSGSALKAGARVVTGLPAPGAVIGEGDVLLAISGRPVFLLAGSQPSYRDLGPGMSGRDVEQLETALQRLGFDPGTVDASYDDATAGAVSALYRARGFGPLSATASQLAAVRPLEADLISGARAQGGVQLPADEVVYVPEVPVRVTALVVGLGAPPEGPLVTVTDSVVAVAGSVPVEEAALVTPGAEVLIDEPALGITATGKISRVAERPGTDGLDGFHVFFEVVVEAPPPALVGASVRLTVPIESTSGAELAVPISAVTLDPSGASRVQRSVDGRLDFVAVDPGLSADGYVAIGAQGDLAAGDLVVVGFDNVGVTRD